MDATAASAPEVLAVLPEPGSGGEDEMGEGDGASLEPLEMAAVADGLLGEQTWPAEDEYNMGAADEDMEGGGGGGGGGGKRHPNRAGVSDYQAHWLGDDDDDDEDDDEEEEDGEEDEDGLGGLSSGSSARVVSLGSAAGMEALRRREEGGGDGGAMDADEKGAAAEGGGAGKDDDAFSFLEGSDFGGGLKLEGLEDVEMTDEARAAEVAAARRARAAEDMEFPDEVDVPYGTGQTYVDCSSLCPLH